MASEDTHTERLFTADRILRTKSVEYAQNKTHASAKALRTAAIEYANTAEFADEAMEALTINRRLAAIAKSGGVE